MAPRIKNNPNYKTQGRWSWNDELFWSKVVRGTDTECWSWTGATGPQGPLFGANKVVGTDLKPQMSQARRIMWQSYFNEELTHNIWHRCHNSSCMNPLHLTDDHREIDLTLKRRINGTSTDTH